MTGVEHRFGRRSVLRWLLVIAAGLAGALATAAAARPLDPAGSPTNLVWHVETSGSGQETVILLPGIGSRTWVFDDLRSRLESDYRILAITLAGMGGSAPMPQASVRRAIEDLRTIIKRQAGPVHLVGHSMGGLIALRAAEQAPSNLRGLAILDAAPRPARGGVPTDLEANIRRTAEAMVPREEARRSEAVTRWVENMTSPAIRARVLEDFFATDPDLLRARLLETTILLHQIDPARIHVPVHVLAACGGADDCAAKPGEIGAAYVGTGALRLEVVEASHYVMLDRPGDTTSFVLAALGRTAVTSRILTYLPAVQCRV